MNPTSPLLTMTDVTTLYGNNEMLTNVSINIESDKIVCILGSNGAGKTTLIKAILGLVKVKQGKITFKGHHRAENPLHCAPGDCHCAGRKTNFPKDDHAGKFADGCFCRGGPASHRAGIDRCI